MHARSWHDRDVKRLLLVEDNIEEALALARNLRGAGFTLHVAFDVPTATHLLEEFIFDIVLCDLFLPPHSGLDVLDVVSRAQLAPAFVLMSGRRPDEFDWILRKHPRVTAFVPKPCGFDELLDTLERITAAPR